MKVYIKTKSGVKFSVDSGSGTVKNENGIGIIEPSTKGDAKSIPPGGSYTFKIKVNGTPDVSDIVNIKITQRILPNLEEFKEQIVYQN